MNQHRWPKVSLTMLSLVFLTAGATYAQQPGSLDKAPLPTTTQEKPAPRPRETSPAKSAPAQTAADAERQALRREDQSEVEAAVLPYINNFFATTRIGPEDIISVDVFDQPNYSRTNITIPPNGRISYPLIGQLNIAGRTTEELEKEITEKLAEYIREPKVSVNLVQVHSMKYLVVGDVTTPGIYEMTRRMSVAEALAKAGYVTRYGDLKGVSVLRMQPNGQMFTIPVNMKEVEKGKQQDVFLVPGDTVVVPGNKFKAVDKVMSLVTLGYWMRIIAR